jgi:hypothetical protein
MYCKPFRKGKASNAFEANLPIKGDAHGSVLDANYTYKS